MRTLSPKALCTPVLVVLPPPPKCVPRACTPSRLREHGEGQRDSPAGGAVREELRRVKERQAEDHQPAERAQPERLAVVLDEAQLLPIGPHELSRGHGRRRSW
eukprot:2540281-Pleurochrysis_carterae.AAC.3